jgi:hypothetical protein
VNKKVKLRLANKKMTADLFYIVFKLIEGDVALLKNAQSDVLVRSGENRKVDKAARGQGCWNSSYGDHPADPTDPTDSIAETKGSAGRQQNMVI